ncbi:MAG: hypothetical protein AAGF31_03025 [Planctomycetota bacterium]
MFAQRIIALAAVLAFVGWQAVPARAIAPINLGTLGANTIRQNFSRGAKVNSFNEVTGVTTRSGTLEQPFGYADPFIFSILGSGQNGAGHDLNDVGQIVGQVVTPSGLRGFRHSTGGTALLPPLSPTLYPRSYALGTNNLNDAIGVSESPGPLPFFQGTIWAGGGTTPMQVPMNVPRDINDSQLIVGDVFAGPVMAVAFDFANQTTPLPMGTLGGNLSRAFAVNNHGEAVGFSVDTNNQWHAFIWDAANGMTNLGAASLGAIESRAYDINNHGTVVGELNYGGIFRAFCWIDGQILDLNSLLHPNSGWVLETANGVNDSGWITGTGTYFGEQRAFLFRHVPEPSSALLVAVVCLAVTSKRNRHD